MIGLDEFNSLPQKQQLGVLYQNQVMQFDKFDYLEKIIKGYRFTQKIQYTWLGVITALGIWVANKYGDLILPSLLFISLGI